MIDLYQGDCLEVMKTIPDNSVDMVLADLPYGMIYKHSKENVIDTDKIIPFEPLWEQYWRVLKQNGSVVLTAHQPFTSKLIMSQLENFRYCWVWDKGRASNFMHGKYMPLIKTEDVCVFSRFRASFRSLNKMKYNPQGIIPHNKPKINGKNVGGKMKHIRGGPSFSSDKQYIQEYTNYPKNIIEISNDKNEFHPTQKPVELMEYLIKTYTDKGDTVLDNTMGSGTTGVACKLTNRNFIGIELNEEYFNIAKKRIEETKVIVTLDDVMEKL